jgi:hypothetical protein
MSWVQPSNTRAMKNQMNSESQGREAYFSRKKHKSEIQKSYLLRLTLQQHCAVHRATAIPFHKAIASRSAAHCTAGVAHRRLGGAENIILSAGGAKSMMLSARAESIILSVPFAESMMLSA